MLWWRDDDARRDTPALRRLLALAGLHDVPLLLAVVPDDDPGGLPACLRQHPKVEVAQHGVTHVNLQPPGLPAAEFPAAASPEEIAMAINGGAVRLSGLPNRLPFLFVPAWNRLTPNLLKALRLAGKLQLSTRDGSRREAAGLERLDVHVDLLRWKGAPRFRGEARIVWRLLRLLRARRRSGAWQEPIGILTHHLDHDEAAWRFLAQLLRFTLRHERCCWRSPAALLGVECIAAPPAAPGTPAAAPAFAVRTDHP